MFANLYGITWTGYMPTRFMGVSSTRTSVCSLMEFQEISPHFNRLIGVKRSEESTDSVWTEPGPWHESSLQIS